MANRTLPSAAFRLHKLRHTQRMPPGVSMPALALMVQDLVLKASSADQRMP